MKQIDMTIVSKDSDFFSPKPYSQGGFVIVLNDFVIELACHSGKDKKVALVLETDKEYIKLHL